MKPLSFVYSSMIAFCLTYADMLVAEPFIIFDAGNTVSTAPYTAILLKNQQESDFFRWASKELPGVIIDEEDKKISELFPLVTKQLSPLYMSSGIDTYQASLPSPLCVIGSDDLSHRWLRKNANTLKKIKAHCLLVSAPDVDEARLVLNVLGSVPMSLARGDILKQYFKFNHYPVLITERVISQ
jgi:integrating conjugative element protein (TIGR03765 family)